MESPPPPAPAQALRDSVLIPLAKRFPGKSELVELLALALTAAENLLIVGPPGTAKSAVISEFAARIQGRYFEYLLTRFTEPTEIFGPIDVAELRRGRIVTRTEGMLPEAEVVFLDEVFNAGSAILNSLLGILNDGVFRRGNEVRDCDLISVLAATNRVPDDPSLRALDDRFTLRVLSPPVEDEAMADVLDAGWQIERERLRRATPAPATLFTVTEFRRLNAAVADVELDDLRAPLADLVRGIRRAGVFVSDRRLVKLQRLAAASAVLTGRERAYLGDLWPARYFWESEEDAAALAELVEETLAELGAFDELTETGKLHPLASRIRVPAVLLEKLSLLEAEVKRLQGRPSPAAPDGALTDALHNQLQDLAAEHRWCRPRSPAEEDELRELGARLESVSEALQELESSP